MGQLLDNFALKMSASNLPDVEDADPLRSAMENPRIAQIVSLLLEHPLLIEATRRYVIQKIGDVSTASLRALFSDVEIAAMQKEAGIK